MFQPGDKVRCIKPALGLVYNKIYTVLKIASYSSSGSPRVEVSDTFRYSEWSAHRFEAVDEKIRRVTYS